MKHIDGSTFRRVFMAGAAKVMKALDKLNAINVFPVPDGDTGTNLAFTLKGAVEKILHLKRQRHIGEVAKELALGAVVEAKGNSGVIFSQFLAAFAEEVGDKSKLSARELAEAFNAAALKTYQSLENPKEGTILTVIRETSEEAMRVSETNHDMVFLLERMVERARGSLEKTKELLPELKKAGVVDSGAMGFVMFLEGILNYIKEGHIEKLEFGTEKATETAIEQVDDLEHRFCTEAVIESEHTSGHEIKKLLMALGSSLIIVGAGKLFHIHIHTNKPHQVFDLLKEKGKILKKKVDDMLAMNRMFRKKRVAFVIDSGGDVPAELLAKKDVYIVPVHVIVADKSYKDGVDITREEVERLLLEGSVRLTTSQPSPNDFLEVYRRAAEKYGKIMVFTIASGISGTYNSALKAAEMCKEAAVEVVDTKYISVGESLVAYETIKKMEKGASFEEAVQFARQKVIPSIYFIFTLDTMKYIVRSGRVGRLQGTIAEALKIKPIMGFRDGKEIYKITTAFGRKNTIKKMKKMLKQNLDPSRKYDFGLSHFRSEKEVAEIEEFIRKEFDVRTVFISELTPGLSLHLGPGALAIFAVPADLD